MGRTTTVLPTCDVVDHGRQVSVTANAEKEGSQPAAAEVDNPMPAGTALKGCSVSGTIGSSCEDPGGTGVLKVGEFQPADNRPSPAQLSRSIAAANFSFTIGAPSASHDVGCPIDPATHGRSHSRPPKPRGRAAVIRGRRSPSATRANKIGRASCRERV